MMGKIFITSTGYDPQMGKHVKDPYLGRNPSIGACRPDIRRILNRGDHLFVISGKVKGVNQYVMGGLEVKDKIPALQAYYDFPEQRLHKLPNGELNGNIIVNDQGMQHSLDSHDKFEKRVENYIVGINPVAVENDTEIKIARQETMEILCDIFEKKASTPLELIGRNSRNMKEHQVVKLRDWLDTLRQRR